MKEILIREEVGSSRDHFLRAMSATGELVAEDGLSAGEHGRYKVVEGPIETAVVRTWRLRFVPPDDWLQCAYCRGGLVDPAEVSEGVKPMCVRCLDRRLEDQQ